MLKVNKYIILMLFITIFAGCGTGNCKTKFNEDANEIIYQRIRNFKHLGNVWSCSGPKDTNKYISMIYGVKDEDIKILLEDLSKAIHLPNINLRIEIYKDINPKDKNLKPKGKPVMVIKIDKTQGE